MRHFIEENLDLLYGTLRELCAIPAPSGQEEGRAQYCRRWLEGIGAEGVYIDEALNVIFPIGCDGSDKITVFVAHTDTVFPDTEPMPYEDDGTVIRSPGVGDDTASLAVLLLTAKYFVGHGICPPHGIMFVCNSCEEGLGNLKGTRKLFESFAGRIARFVSFDSTSLDHIADRCVGSHRYEVTVRTEGGHSFLSFGNENAIARLSALVCDLYSIKAPQKPGTKTTYNVGKICGGTSVNTIAEDAAMLCEYRSDDEECLAFMKEQFAAAFERAKSSDTDLTVRCIGERPCMGDVDATALGELVGTCQEIIESTAGVRVGMGSGSTDCNIPLSLGIPAVCIGVYNGGGAHTRGEWIEKSSLPTGLEIAIRTATVLTAEK